MGGGRNGTPGSIERVGGGFFGSALNPFDALGAFAGGAAGYTPNGGTADGGNPQKPTLNLDRGAAAKLADTLRKMYQGIGSNAARLENGRIRVSGPPVLKSYPITSGKAEELARILGETYRDSPTIRITASGIRISVYAPPADQVDIQMEIAGMLGTSPAPAPAPLYDPPTFTAHARIFDDLLWYAPGINSSMADVAAVLEAEAKENPDVKPGTIDHEARRLIDKARAIGWRKFAVDTKGRQPAYVVNFDGEGRFAYDHLLECGLFEQVICDGKTLWHIYPEIGLGAKRVVLEAGFHREELQALVPWLVLEPPRILPLGAMSGWWKTVSSAFSRKRRIRSAMTMASLGSICSSTWFLTPTPAWPNGRLRPAVMPEKKTIARWRYGDDGTITLIDPANHLNLDQVKLKVSVAKAPSLEPGVKDVVIVPMPLRTQAYIASKLGGAKADTAIYDDEQAITSLATACAIGDQANATQLFERSFHDKGDNRIGLRVLLASGGAGWVGAPEEQPPSPLATYLASHVKNVDLNNIGGPQGGFVQRLARFRAVWDKRDVERLETLKNFVKSPAPLPVFDYALLVRICRNGLGGDETLQAALVEACKVFKDEPGLSYSARYEVANAIVRTGNKVKGRELYRELYLDTLDAQIMPPINQSFRW